MSAPSRPTPLRHVAKRRWLAAPGLLLVLALAVDPIVGRTLPARLVASPNGGCPGDLAIDASSRAALGVTAERTVAAGAVTLAAWVVDPVGPVRGTVLVLHGVLDRKESHVGTARALAREGLRALAVDLRGHGCSTGSQLGYGVLEAADLRVVLDVLERDGTLRGPLGVWGTSYGAATALQLASDERVRAVVAVAPFASLRQIVPAYARRLLPGVHWLIRDSTLQGAITEAARLAGFDADDADSMRAICRTTAPVLLVHGTADIHIPIEHSEAILAARPTGTELVRVAGVDHLSIGGGERAVAFLATALR